MGDAYIINCTPKVTRNLRSRYFVVNEEMIMPKLKPKKPINTIKNGTKMSAQFGCIESFDIT